MNKVFMSMILSAMCCVNAGAEGLDYKSCAISGVGYVSDMPFLYPLAFVSVGYDDVVLTTESAKAMVRCGEKVVADAVGFDVDEYTSSAGKKTSRLVVKFDQTDLPKGESYSIVINANSVALASNSEVTNEEMVLTFHVPENMDDYIYNIKAEGSGGKYSGLSFYVSADVDQISNAQWSLTRNGVTVATYDGEVKWNDWNLSIGTVTFDPVVSFDADADYALVVPEGFFCSKYRSDITNGELIFPLHKAEAGIADLTVAPSAAPVIYNLQGRRVATPVHGGLYIIDGKKVRL